MIHVVEKPPRKQWLGVRLIGKAGRVILLARIDGIHEMEPDRL